MLGLLKDIYFQSTSEEETNAIERWLGTSKRKIYYLTNIPSIPKEEYSHPQKQSGNARLIFLSRIIWKKNLLFAIQCLKEIRGSVQFDIYGPIEDKEYWQKCQREIKTLPNNIKVNYCGLIGHDEVHKTFARYDAFLFPTLSENFGHVIAEALSVGCPVIISDQTPFVDVEKYGAGYVISLENIHQFTCAINKVIIATNDDFQIWRKNTLEYFENKLSVVELKRVYMECFKCIYNKF